MNRIVLSSKLLDIDVECNFLAELGDLMDDTAFSLEKGWYAKITMKEHPQAPSPDIIYTIRYVKKDNILKIIEKTRIDEHEHPVDIPEDLDPLPFPFITDFLMGLPTAMEYT